MGLFGDLIKTAVDVATTPLDIIDDVADTIEGRRPTNTAKKLKEITNDVRDSIADTLDGDLL